MEVKTTITIRYIQFFALFDIGYMLSLYIKDGGGEELGGCCRDFRNKPYPVKLKLRYYKNTLSLHYHGGVTEFDDYELCTFVEVSFIKNPF